MVVSGEDDYQPALVEGEADRFVVLSGASGAGKSTLLTELGRRGYRIYEEAGRQVIKEQQYIGGDAIPSADAARFLELTASRSIHNLISAARAGGLAFFDRGIVDQVSAFEYFRIPLPQHLANAAARLRYRQTVFMMPPWREIFANDSERRHSFADAIAYYETLLRTYERFGYRAIIVPQAAIAMRADFVIAHLAVPA
jgi:predicted ATPase